MSQRENRNPIQTVTERLRGIVLDAENGALIGSEEALIEMLGCSRSTVRQVARLLEREGLLRVKRGINGGYFGARPDAGTIEATVSAYLETLDMDAQDVTSVASLLWVEAMRRAASAGRPEANAVVKRLRTRLNSLTENSSFDDARKIEVETQAEIFKLANSAYIKLIFDINVAFSRRTFTFQVDDDDSAEHRAFVRDWRNAKLMELSAISSGDLELAAMAGQHSRKIWHRRLVQRFAGLTRNKPGTRAGATPSV